MQLYQKFIFSKIGVLVFVIVGRCGDAFAQSSNPYISRIYEYRPAPGQFVNIMPEWEEGDGEVEMIAKCEEILVGDEPGMVCLGAYGGYITFGFDHPLVNVPEQYDIFVKGNAFISTSASDGGNSEPGIVMVSMDSNANGLPDDEWYELSGSADVDSVGLVDYAYEICYSYSPMQPVPWSDNRGGSGVVERNSFHGQEYFPMWLAGEGQLSFRGTLLPKNAYYRGNLCVLRALRYGYADNLPNYVGGERNPACCFDLDWAVDANRRRVYLDHVDFVRVYCAVNQCMPMIGETSTEFAGAEDLHPEEIPTGVDVICDGAGRGESVAYDLMGRRVCGVVKGVAIVNGRIVVGGG